MRLARVACPHCCRVLQDSWDNTAGLPERARVRVAGLKLGRLLSVASRRCSICDRIDPELFWFVVAQVLGEDTRRWFTL